jgi:deoxyhypusine synthase
MSPVDDRPSGATAAVLAPSAPIPEDAVHVVGPDFEKTLDLASFLESYKRIGFQANSFGKAVGIVNQMVTRNLSQRLFIILSHVLSSEVGNFLTNH